MNTELINGVKLYSHDDMVVRHSEGTGEFEPETFDYIKKNADTTGLFLDVGAYTGIYSLWAAKNGFMSALAIEPNPVVRLRLLDNILLNGSENVHHFMTAVSDVVGRCHLLRKFPMSSASKISEVVDLVDSREYEVDVTTLDTLYSSSIEIPVKVIKIDVEGQECNVLKGSSVLIATERPTVITECLDQDTLDQVTGIMTLYGYSLVCCLDERNYVWEPQ